MFRIAFFASGGGHLIQRILDAYASDVRIKFVGLIGDEGADRSCKYAKAAHVSIARLYRQRFSDLSEFNQMLYQTVLPWEPDLIITTFNHIITKPVLDRWAGRIMNVHYAAASRISGSKTDSPNCQTWRSFCRNNRSSNRQEYRWRTTYNSRSHTNRPVRYRRTDSRQAFSSRRTHDIPGHRMGGRKPAGV